MADVNPKLLRRILALRQFPMFATAELAELATIAENVVETSFRPGAVVAAAGARMPGLHLVLDGRIAAGRPWGPREIFGELEAFAGRPHEVAAVAEAETQTLLLSATDLAEVVEDNFGVLLALVRDLAARLLAVPSRGRTIAVPEVSGPLGLVERLIVLRQLAPFIGARLQGLAMLAHDSEELSWAPGAVVARAGDLATGTALVLDGALRAVDRDGASHEIARGQAFGGLETLAGVAHAATLEAITPVRALHSSATAMFDVLEDHPDIAMSMIGVFARGLLDGPAVPAAAAPDRGN